MKSKLKFIVPRPAARARRGLQVRARQAGRGRGQAQGRGQVYVLPKEFLINLDGGRFAKLSVGARARPRRSAAAAGRRQEAAKPPEGFGTLPQEAVIRDIVTDALTDDTPTSSSSAKAARSSRAAPQVDQEEDRRQGRGSPVHRRHRAVGEIDDRSESTRPCETDRSSPTPERDRARASRRGRRRPRAAARRAGGARRRDRPHPHDIGETLALGPGSIVTLNRMAGEPVDLLVNGKPDRARRGRRHRRGVRPARHRGRRAPRSRPGPRPGDPIPGTRREAITMKRLHVEQDVALSVGDVTVDCRVAALPAARPRSPRSTPARAARSRPPARAPRSCSARRPPRDAARRDVPRMSDDDLHFAERTASARRPLAADHRRKSARLPVTLPAMMRQLDYGRHAVRRGAQARHPRHQPRRLRRRDRRRRLLARRARGVRARADERRDDRRHRAGRARGERDVGAALRALAPADRVRLVGFLAALQSRGRRQSRVRARTA